MTSGRRQSVSGRHTQCVCPPQRCCESQDAFYSAETHPAIRSTFEGGKRIAYGARSLTAGGLMSLSGRHTQCVCPPQRCCESQDAFYSAETLRRGITTGWHNQVQPQGPRLLGYCLDDKGKSPHRYLHLRANRRYARLNRGEIDWGRPPTSL